MTQNDFNYLEKELLSLLDKNYKLLTEFTDEIKHEQNIDTKKQLIEAYNELNKQNSELNDNLKELYNGL